MPVVAICQKHMLHDLYYYVDPNHTTKIYQNILIFSNMDRTITKRMRKSANKMHYHVTFYDDIFPPIKNYTDEEINSKCNSLGIDGIIHYYYLGSEVTGTTTSTTGNVFLYKNGLGNYNGNTVSKQSRYYKMELYFLDVKNQSVKEFYVTGGYGPNYSYHIGSAVFMKSLKKIKELKIGLPPL